MIELIHYLPENLNGCHIPYGNKIAAESQCACVNKENHRLSKSKGKTTSNDFLKSAPVGEGLNDKF